MSDELTSGIRAVSSRDWSGLVIAPQILAQAVPRSIFTANGQAARVHVSLGSVENRLAIIMSDIDNPGPSITNCCEDVANMLWIELSARCALRNRAYPVWIEHYPGLPGGANLDCQERFALIQFADDAYPMHLQPIYRVPRWRPINPSQIIFDRQSLRSMDCGHRIPRKRRST